MSSYNTSVKCIQEYNPGKGATLGQTYKVEDGQITYDNGQKQSRQCEDLEDLNNYNLAKFQEVKKRGRPKKEVDHE